MSGSADEGASSFGGLATGAGGAASKLSKVAGISATAASGIAAAGTAAAVAAGKLTQLTIEASKYAEAIDRASQQSGVAAEQIQEVYLQASRLDSQVDLDTIRDTFKELALRTQEAREGTGEAQEAFERLGISDAQLESLDSTTEVFQAVREEMRGLSQQERVLTAEQVFGGEGGQRLIELMNLSAEEAKNLREEIEGLALTDEEKEALNAIAEETNSITQEWQALQRELGADWASIAQPLLEIADNVLRKIRKITDEINGIEWFIGAVTGNFNPFDNVQRPSMGEQEGVNMTPQHYIEDQEVEKTIIDLYESIDPVAEIELDLLYEAKFNESALEADAQTAGLTNPMGDTSNLQGIMPSKKAEERIRRLKRQLRPMKFIMRDMGAIGKNALGSLSNGLGQVIAQVLTLDKSISSLGDVFKKMKNVVVQVLQQIISKLASAAIIAAALAPFTGGGSFGSIFSGALSGGVGGGFDAATQSASSVRSGPPTVSLNVSGQSRLSGEDIVTSYNVTQRNQRRKGRL
jgi:uncharacterized membrane protein